VTRKRDADPRNVGSRSISTQFRRNPLSYGYFPWRSHGGTTVQNCATMAHLSSHNLCSYGLTLTGL
jgi:hypothetical protein